MDAADLLRDRSVDAAWKWIGPRHWRDLWRGRSLLVRALASTVLRVVPVGPALRLALRSSPPRLQRLATLTRQPPVPHGGPHDGSDEGRSPRSVALGAHVLLRHMGSSYNAVAVLAAERLRGHPCWRDGSLRRSSLRGADLAKARLGSVNLPEADLEGARLRDAFLFRAVLAGGRFDCADLREAFLVEADLRDASLAEADLRGTDLRLADLTGANLESADLQAASLCEAHLDGASFRGARLESTDLRRTDLRLATNLTREQIGAACGDSGTRLPPGLRRPLSWSV